MSQVSQNYMIQASERGLSSLLLACNLVFRKGGRHLMRNLDIEKTRVQYTGYVHRYVLQTTGKTQTSN